MHVYAEPHQLNGRSPEVAASRCRARNCLQDTNSLQALCSAARLLNSRIQKQKRSKIRKRFAVVDAAYPYDLTCVGPPGSSRRGSQDARDDADTEQLNQHAEVARVVRGGCLCYDHMPPSSLASRWQQHGPYALAHTSKLQRFQRSSQKQRGDALLPKQSSITMCVNCKTSRSV